MTPPAQPPILRYFAHSHLPLPLRLVSERFSALAVQLTAALPPCEERDVALRKLLEAKDAAVRAALPLSGTPIMECKERCGVCAYCKAQAQAQAQAQ